MAERCVGQTCYKVDGSRLWISDHAEEGDGWQLAQVRQEGHLLNCVPADEACHMHGARRQQQHMELSHYLQQQGNHEKHTRQDHQVIFSNI